MNLLEYIGHFHPVLVHLPIGILLAGIALEVISRRKGFRKLRKGIQLLLLFGFLSAALSCLTGYLLSQSGEYDADRLSIHQWLGISVAVVSLITLLLARKKKKEIRMVYTIVIFGLAILIGLTGHAGGQLTHGVDFLKPPALSMWFSNGEHDELLKIDWKTAEAYKDIVAPILEKKCTGCHGSSKQKGKLRLDQPQFIVKGGKDGPVISGKDGEEGEIVKRIHLDMENDDHMPPKEKRQLSPKEIVLLSFWIENGADFKARFRALNGGDSVARLLQSSKEARQEQRLKMISMPDPAVIERLRTGGVTASFLAEKNGFISLSFINADTSKISSLLNEIPTVREQVSELKLIHCRLTRQDWSVLSKLTSLVRLNLEHSNVTDEDLNALQSLSQLDYLNLVGTRITLSGMEKIKNLAGLKKLFLYQSKIPEDTRDVLHRIFPDAEIDFGNYKVPTLASDTTLLTKPFSQ